MNKINKQYLFAKQVTKFIIVGFSAVAVDFVVYYFASTFLPTNIAKAIGFIAGTFLGYNLNKSWTWRKEGSNNKWLRNYAILYLISFILNILVNHFCIKNLNFNVLSMSYGTTEFFAMKLTKFAAFILATGTSTVINYIGLRFWVFKD